jgi:hypothetical protein
MKIRQQEWLVASAPTRSIGASRALQHPCGGPESRSSTSVRRSRHQLREAHRRRRIRCLLGGHGPGRQLLLRGLGLELAQRGQEGLREAREGLDHVEQHGKRHAPGRAPDRVELGEWLSRMDERGPGGDGSRLTLFLENAAQQRARPRHRRDARRDPHAGRVRDLDLDPGPAGGRSPAPGVVTMSFPSRCPEPLAEPRPPAEPERAGVTARGRPLPPP